MLRTLSKKLTAALLSVIMLFALLPTAALAVGDEAPVSADSAVTVNEYHVLWSDLGPIRDYCAEEHGRIDMSEYSCTLIRLNFDCDIVHPAASNAATKTWSATVGTHNHQPESLKSVTFHFYRWWLPSEKIVTIPASELTIVPYEKDGIQFDFAEIYLTGSRPVAPIENYTVTFDPANGDDPVQQVVAANTTAVHLTPPERDNYTFLGWYADGAQESFDFTTPITADLTLTARWKENEIPPVVEYPYTLTIDYHYDNNGNGEAVSKAVLDSTLATVGTLPDGVLYTVSDGEIALKITESAVISDEGKPTFNYGTFVFDSLSDGSTLKNGGQHNNPIVALDKNNVKAPGLLYKKASVVPPEEPKTTKVEIWHYYIDGTGTQDLNRDTPAENALGNLGVITRDSTQITKAYVDSLSTLNFYKNTNQLDVGYTGHTIWAHPDDGSAAVSVTPNGDGHIDLTDVKDLRIHLLYYQTGYNVIYNANGGTDANGKTVLNKRYNTANSHTVLPNEGDSSPGFVREGYTFAGWAADSEGTKSVTVGETVNPLEKGQSVTYYAQWHKDEEPAPITYTVTYQYTGSVPAGMTPPVDGTPYTAEAEVALAATPTAPANYAFTGWTLPQGLTAQDGKFTMPAEHVVVTGNWTYTEPSGGGGGIPSRYTVTVNYLEQDTSLKLADAYVSPRLTSGSAYDVTEQTALPISGYTIVSVDGAPSGTLRKNETITVYYTAEQDIPEEEIPLAPTPEGGTNGETDIPETDIPTAPIPDADESGTAGNPGASVEGDTIIVEEDIPLGNLPQTGTTAQGVDPTVTLGFLALSAALAAAGLGMALSRKKKDEL